uniref:Uncharacterized protein n=1 Tax=Anguilla anguilla TaxID=7936 RepID=A0A0E9UV94_ANGAN
MVWHAHFHREKSIPKKINLQVKLFSCPSTHHVNGH